MDRAIVERIRLRLSEIEREQGVRILWAVESGSRAWGFPSPDSDYDCRFIYVRPVQDYLALVAARDVIEDPPDPVFDISGWDLAKALRLAMKGNAVVFEWLTSPIRYSGESAFRDAFFTLAQSIADRKRIGHHYLHLAYSMRKRVVDPEGGIRLKKLFYVLRPAMALRVLRLNPAVVLPPMHFQTLMAAADCQLALVEELEALIARKALTRELGSSTASRAAQEFYEAEIQEAERWISKPSEPEPDTLARANAFFRDMIALYAPSPGST